MKKIDRKNYKIFQKDNNMGLNEMMTGPWFNQEPEFKRRDDIRLLIEETCRRQANIVVEKDIAEHPKGTNIFLGIGLVTQRKISPGLGFGIIPMACLARDLQQNFHDKNLNSQIFVLIADQHGLNERLDPKSGEEIAYAADSALRTCERLFTLLGSPRITTLKASDPSWPTGNHSYTEMETADILHAHERLGCGVKIGWQSKRKPKDGSAIRDEKWFDEQAKLTGKLDRMSFLRIPEWISLATRLDPSLLPKRSMKNINTSPQHLPLPPYTGEEGFHLGIPMNILDEFQKRNLSRDMTSRFGEFDSLIKRIVGIKERTERLELVQQCIDACI